ncbi:ATP-binding protein [Brevibacillus ruminantium]|uniref:histidine kinase n=1 Tax=Brevibacillus ruminantium TaxID=2950604 RepID=A0ABY4WEQ9_9BACL|nr:histidine kinase dimerization/phospho-acceptor domain-containing protein [Brevibacillus ruminantium]USG65557.1 ATP-binding protein [Brevibacillus ruminantium]
MVTKSKNKLILTLAALLFVCLPALSFLTSEDILQRTNYLQEDHYFSTDLFENELSQFVDILKNYYIEYRANYLQQSDEEKVGVEQYERLKQNYEEQVKTALEETTQQFSDQIKHAEAEGKPQEAAALEKERELQLQKIRQEHEQAFQSQIREIVSSGEQEFKNIQQSLALREGSFHYYIRNKKNGDVYANIKELPTAAELRSAYLYSVRFPNSTTSNRSTLTWINQDFVTNQLEGTIAVPKDVQGYSMIHSNAQYYSSIRLRLIKECVLLVMFVAATVALFFYLRRHAAELTFVDRTLALLRRIPIDVRMLVLAFAILCAYILASTVSFFQLPIRPEQFLILGLESCAAAYLILCILEVARMRQDSTIWTQQWKDSLFVKYRELLTDTFANRKILFKLVVSASFSLAFPFAAIILLYALGNHEGTLLLLSLGYCLFYVFFVLPYILRRISLMNKIFRGAEEMASGNLDHQIHATGKGNLFRLASNLNNMKQGLKQSLEGQMKSERMKSELITNVSHDLKTPLTSIVNYVNLLKSENLRPEDMSNYIEILDRKTQRLKVLIDDLFEASKMASGAVDLQLENVNVASLLNQALAEFSDKIEDSSLTFRVQVENQQMYAKLDGKKTWRVMENLIVNALKYSMPNTRVYISLHDEDSAVVMSIKNVSAYEIDFDAKELFERFKRGDKSRHTEGSGLGLAIAKSIVELQGGSLSIEIDGDYFKVNVVFPK